MDVARTLGEVGPVLDKDCPVPSLPEVTDTSVPPVEATRVVAIDVSHPSPELTGRSAAEEVVVVRHQAERMDHQGIAPDKSPHLFLKLLPIRIVNKDAHPSHTSPHDMIASPFVLDA